MKKTPIILVLSFLFLSNLATGNKAVCAQKAIETQMVNEKMGNNGGGGGAVGDPLAIAEQLIPFTKNS